MTMPRALTAFLMSCVLFGAAVKCEDEEIEWLIQGIRERAKNEEVEQKSFIVLNTARQCFAKLGRDEPPLIKKMLTNVLFEGTVCASTKLGIEDPVQRHEAEKFCYINAAESAKGFGDMTNEEIALYDAVGHCVVPQLSALAS